MNPSRSPAGRLAAASVAAAVLVVLVAPLALAGVFAAVPLTDPDTPLEPAADGAGGGVVCGDLGVILATIRTVESGGNYQATARASTASGAYQYLNGTWAGYGGYPAASLAPPAVQDQRAAADVTRILAGSAGDLTVIGPVWYIGHIPQGDEWDRVPHPGFGNTITPRQYQQRWLTVHARLAAEAPAACPPPTAAPTAGGFALPLPRRLLTDATLAAPHHDYPAADLAVPTGTPVYALTDGAVASVTAYTGNCLSSGDCTGRRCGIGLTLITGDGHRIIYCHGSALTAAPGDRVTAGQQIMASGNTGNSTGPHLHLGIRTPTGTDLCPQPLLTALHRGDTPPTLTSLPGSGCSS